MMKLIQASSGSGRLPTPVLAAAAPEVMTKRCRSWGSSRKRMPRLYGSGSMVRSGMFSRRARPGIAPPCTMTENATTMKMIS